MLSTFYWKINGTIVRKLCQNKVYRKKASMQNNNQVCKYVTEVSNNGLG